MSGTNRWRLLESICAWLSVSQSTRQKGILAYQLSSSGEPHFTTKGAVIPAGWVLVVKQQWPSQKYPCKCVSSCLYSHNLLCSLPTCQRCVPAADMRASCRLSWIPACLPWVGGKPGCSISSGVGDRCCTSSWWLLCRALVHKGGFVACIFVGKKLQRSKARQVWIPFTGSRWLEHLWEFHEVQLGMEERGIELQVRKWKKCTLSRD